MPDYPVSGASPDFLSYPALGYRRPSPNGKNHRPAERDISSGGMRRNIRRAGLGFNSSIWAKEA